MQSDRLKLNCITLVWVYLCNDTEIQSSRKLNSHFRKSYAVRDEATKN